MAASRPGKKRENQSRGAGTKDVFARLQAEEVDELDRLVSAITPATSRAALIAHLIRQYIAEQREKPEGGAR